MYAAPKEDCFSCVRWNGPYTEYPRWFSDLLKEGSVWENDVNDWRYYGDQGEYALSNGDVIMVNGNGVTRYYSSIDFKTLYFEAK